MFKQHVPYSRYVSLERIPDLQVISVTSTPLELGARLSLTRCIEVFHQVAAGVGGNPTGYHHLEEVARHWQLVANLAVRNVSPTHRSITTYLLLQLCKSSIKSRASILHIPPGGMDCLQA